MVKKAGAEMAEIMTEKRKRPELVITSAILLDKETAQKSPENVMPTIPGAFIRTKKINGRHYYSLVKSYRQGEEIYQVQLRYYGLRPPRRRSNGQ